MHHDPEVRQQAVRTIIVARHLKFGTDDLEPPPGETRSKTDKSHNKSFNPVCTKDKLDEPEEMCESPVAVFAATQIMKEVRKIAREMIRHPSIAHDAIKPPSSDNSFASTMSGDGRNWTRQQSDSNVTPTLANKTPGRVDGDIAPDIIEQATEAEKVLNQLAQLNQLNNKMTNSDATNNAPELDGF